MPTRDEPMDKIDSSDLWRQIPPEEKFDLIARAHSLGVLACLVTFLVGCTLAVGLKQSWLMWGSLIMTPFVFQFFSGRAWRGIRPNLMLEYLAARSAARRYAFTTRAKDLTLNFIFRGTIERQFEDDEAELKALEAAIENTTQTQVWVALFKDAIVMMSEMPGGAKIEFAHLLNDKLVIEGRSSSDRGEYSVGREVFLSYSDRKPGPQKVKLTSRYPAALVVFEKKIQKLINENIQLAALPEAASEIAEGESSGLLGMGNDEEAL